MSLRLVASSAMFADDARKIVRPYVAVRKLRDSFSSSWITIQGFGQYVTPLGNRDIQLNKLVRDVEEGRVFLLDDSSGFGVVEGCIGGSDSFCSRVNAIKSSGKRRPMSGVSYQPVDCSVNIDEYTPEPIKPEEPAEQQERTEFLCGWSESQKSQSKVDVIAALLPSKYQQDKRSFIDRHNDHLKSHVREGEIIVLPTREPKTDEEVAELNELKIEARKVSTALHSVSEEEAQVAVRFFPLLDYFGTKEFYEESLAVTGSIVAGFGAFFESIEETFRAINKLYIDEVASLGSAKLLSEAFYTSRAKLFKQLDSGLHRLTFNCVGIPVFKKLKNTLGLSVKSVVYHGKDMLNIDGVLKSFAPRINAVVKWIKGTKTLGVVGAVLGSLTSIPVIAEAFTSEKGRPVKTVSVEAAAIYGGYTGGNLGAQVGAGLATLVVGAVSGGPITLGIAIIVGGAIGAYYGALLGSDIFKWAAESFFDFTDSVIEYAEEHGGFFSWNVDQI